MILCGSGIKGGKNMRIKIDEIQVKIKFVEEAQLKAILSLDFGDFIIKGFRVQESDHENDFGEKLWITPPSYRDRHGKYHPMFFIADKELWKELERKIWEEYKSQNSTQYQKRFGIKDLDI